MKLIGFFLLVVSWGGVGLVLSLSLTRRRRELESFALGVELLETEMLFAQNPLWLSFDHVGAKVPGHAGKVFKKIGQGLAAAEEENGCDTFKKVLAAEAESLYINPGDREVLSALSWDLGITDLESQGRRLKSTGSALRARVADAVAVENKWRRIYGMGGWMMGIIFGLLLI